MSKRLPISAVRPTQLYISREKLLGVLEWFDVDTLDYEPLPVFEYEGEWYLWDGHTRAFVATLAGAETLRVARDTELRSEYDFGVYLRCIQWCADAGIDSVVDLIGRVVEPETYETEWIERCQAIDETPGT